MHRYKNMKLLIPFFLSISFSCFAQEVDKRGTIKIEKASCIKHDEGDSVYISVDRMPEFPGGSDSLNKWMNTNLRYPKPAAEQNRFGTVFGSFVVLSDGDIVDIRILKGVDKDFEKEAMRLLKLMPNWHPGSCNGTFVPVKINFPIKFILK